MKTYKEDIIENTIQCSTCTECQLPNKSGCVPVWQYGNNFDTQSKKILFVGKTAIGQYPPTCYEDANNYYKNYNVPFWKYTREISEELNLDWEDIAITNLIKCNISNSSKKHFNDNTTQEMKQNCIVKKQFIRKEISILKPSHIIFYTHYYYEDEIKQIFDSIQNISFTTVPCGKKQMPFWEFKGQIQEQSSCVLRLGHPQGKKREDFVRIVVDFIKRTSNK